MGLVVSMSDLRKAAQQAMEALEYAQGGNTWIGDQSRKAIESLRAALAQPEPEPFGYLWPTGRHPEFRFTQQKFNGVDGTPVYTSPPQRKPLTEEEIAQIDWKNGETLHDFARAIERAHGIGEWWPVFQPAAADSEGGEV